MSDLRRKTDPGRAEEVRDRVLAAPGIYYAIFSQSKNI